MGQETRSREEVYAESVFEWIKTEREGEICKFDHFDFDNSSGIEFVVFTDGSRVNSRLIGDAVLMHSDESLILGKDLNLTPSYPSHQPVNDEMTPEDWRLLGYGPGMQITPAPKQGNTQTQTQTIDPVEAILQKSKKKNEKLTLTVTVKVPTADLYNVVKESFRNVDEVLLESVMKQIQERALRDAVKKELQNIYSKKKS